MSGAVIGMSCSDYGRRAARFAKLAMPDRQHRTVPVAWILSHHLDAGRPGDA
jgi:hypothetical protein